MKAFAAKKKRTAFALRRGQGPVLRASDARAEAQRRRIGRILHGPRVQAKLKVGAPDDAYEREADRVADQVMKVRRDDSPSAAEGQLGVSTARPAIQRISALVSPSEEDAVVVPRRPEEETPEDATIARIPASSRVITPSNGPDGGAGAVDSGFASRLASAKSRGTPLEPAVRRFMEGRFDLDFGAVRVHTDTEASRLANGVEAHAFTLRDDIYFAGQAYRPETPAGQWTIAHELTHVAQQTAPRRNRESTGARRTALQAPPTIQRMSARGRAIRHDVRHWPQQISGTDYSVQTNAGARLLGWNAYSPWQWRYHYWCHGLSLGTYGLFGFSVYSGPPMARVVRDEWRAIPSNTARPGDIAVWIPGHDHSAIFTSVSLSGGQLDPAGSRLDTKNGQAAQKNDSLANITNSYRSISAGSPRVFRKK